MIADFRAKEVLSRLGANPRGAEIGVQKGSLSRRLFVRNDLHLTMVDSWGVYRETYGPSEDWHAMIDAEQNEKHYQSALSVTEYAEDRRTVIRADSVKAAELVKDLSLDFVFIDADHSYEGCKGDIDAWYPKLVRGGLLCGHDYHAPDYPRWGVKKAVEEFAALHGVSVELGQDDTWFIRLPGSLPKPNTQYNQVKFVCVKWGTKYGPEYVNILADMVFRNCALPCEFICFTDSTDGLDDGISVQPLPGSFNGWWNKVYLFKPELFDPHTRIVYLDLDTVITGPLEGLIDYKGIAHDWLYASYNSSVMVWDADEHTEIYTRFTSEVAEKVHGDQDWITAISTWKMLPAEWVPSYKLHCREWPTDSAKVVCFHGEPKPHEVITGWVPEMWTMSGLSVPRYFSRVNNDEKVMVEQVEHNKKRACPSISQLPPHGETLCLVGGGPSLSEWLVSLRLEQARGAKIWALNGVHDFLIERGFIPDAMVMLDSRAENVSFVRKPHKDVTYYIASQCHPSVFDALEGYNVIRWTGYGWGISDSIVIGGGQTVGLKAPCLAYTQGFRRLKFFGYDSSYRDEQNHAYPQPMNDGEAMTDVVVRGHKFSSAKWMVRQVRDFRELANELMRMGSTIEIYTGGLFGYVYSEEMTQPQGAAVNE